MLTETSAIADIVTVTVTVPNAVVWVDQNRNVISIEFCTASPSTTSATDSFSMIVTTTNAGVSSVTKDSPSSTFSSAEHPSFTHPDMSGPSMTIQDSTSSLSSSSTSSTSTSTPLLTEASSDSTTTTSPLLSSSSFDQPNTAPIPPDNATSGSGSNSYNGVGNGISNGYGIAYDTIDSSGSCKSESSINGDIEFLAQQGYKLVRVYDIDCNIGLVVSAAAANGMKVFTGINGIGNVVSDLGTLIRMINGNWASIHTINIGNEVVNDGGSAAAVIAAIGTARGLLSAAGFTGSVVTVDTFNQHEANPTLCAASDYCAANCHAFFDANIAASGAGSFVSQQASTIVGKSGKPVIITESGWPYNGSANGDAVPSLDNQRIAISSLLSAFSSDPDRLILFQGFDASYKNPGALGVEQYFGIYESDHDNRPL